MPKTGLTVSKYEANLADLDAAVDDCRSNGLFDTAETIEEAMLFMRLLRDSELLAPDPVEVDTEPVTADQEVLREMCARMKELQAKAVELKAQSAEVKIPLDELRLRKIPEMLEALGVKTVTFHGIGRVQTAPDIYASTKKGKKPEAMQWLRDCGYEGMISETYNASSLKALFRRQIVEGVEIPDDIFNVTPFVRASIVKA